MWLSELHGRLGQLLKEYGDMQVVRFRRLNIDGIIGNTSSSFVDFTSNNFGVVVDYKQKKNDENTFEEIKVSQHLVIEIPF